MWAQHSNQYYSFYANDPTKIEWDYKDIYRLTQVFRFISNKPETELHHLQMRHCANGYILTKYFVS